MFKRLHSQSFFNNNESVSVTCRLNRSHIDFVKINDFEQKLKLKTISLLADEK
jgi:hypothetical protein